MAENKKYFWGWSNMKWFMREFMAMYSNKDSYFSKKRFESSIAFIGAMFLVIGHAIYSRATITNSEIIADAALLFAIAGYTVNQIQKEKKELPNMPTRTIDETEAPAPAKKEDNKGEDFSKDEAAV